MSPCPGATWRNTRPDAAAHSPSAASAWVCSAAENGTKLLNVAGVNPVAEAS